jgi:hypothetical protein
VLILSNGKIKKNINNQARYKILISLGEDLLYGMRQPLAI